MHSNTPRPQVSLAVSRAFPQSLLGYPPSADYDTAAQGSAAFGSSPQDTPSTIVVIKLLDRATAALGSDQAAAKESIVQASALLKEEYGWTDRRPRDAVQTMPNPARGGLAPWQVRKVARHIDESLASSIRAHDCARIAHLSTSHFSRAFKASFGETFFKYVIRCRTARAQQLMVMTDAPLCQIALDCGFADQSHLSRQFRDRVGATPAAWRRQRRERRNAI